MGLVGNAAVKMNFHDKAMGKEWIRRAKRGFIPYFLVSYKWRY
jgi:hypothetical protein